MEGLQSLPIIFWWFLIVTIENDIPPNPILSIKASILDFMRRRWCDFVCRSVSLVWFN